MGCPNTPFKFKVCIWTSLNTWNEIGLAQKLLVQMRLALVLLPGMIQHRWYGNRCSNTHNWHTVSDATKYIFLPTNTKQDETSTIPTFSIVIRREAEILNYLFCVKKWMKNFLFGPFQKKFGRCIPSSKIARKHSVSGGPCYKLRWKLFLVM